MPTDNSPLVSNLKRIAKSSRAEGYDGDAKWIDEAADLIIALETRVKALEEALGEWKTTMKVISKALDPVLLSAHVHGVHYEGPKFDDIESKTDALLAANAHGEAGK